MDKWNRIILMPQEFHDQIVKLAAMIPKGKYKYVYGIPRGGLIVAVYLSHYCKLELLCNPFYVGKPNSLVVDDIADTGKTLASYPYSAYDTATIHYKPRSIIKPTYFVEEIKNDDWIVYPYEKIEEKPNREL